MMTQEQSQEERFQIMLQGLFDQASDGDTLKKIRSKAWDHFLELGLPTRKTEVYKYIRLRQLYSKSFVEPKEVEISAEQVLSFVYPECKEAYLTFVNGEYREELSCFSKLPEKVVISPLDKASRTYGAFLNNHWAKTMKEETDPFAVINAAMHRSGLFIYVPPGTCVEQPIQILNIVDTAEDTALLTPRVQVFAGKSAEVRFNSSLHIVSGDDYGINQLIDFAIDENAKVKYTQATVENGENNWHFDAVRATLKRNSHFHSININEGTYSYRNDYHVVLAQEGCEAELDGVWMLNDRKESHVNVLIDHQAPHCLSRQLFKGVLRDVSRSSFEGKILVRQAAQKTDAFQLNNNLLLSERAHSDSKPNLEIFADDVKASHGATVGRLDEEQLFYLKSRGFSDDDAKNMLIFGYCKEVIDQVGIQSLFEKLKSKAENYLG
ncbi:MAG: Fe-S cluster assembly protein SufD [Chlamydiota bacterium]|nr:Fe-S cluster assembly protein SufD [Chlamydiota bacterium]